MRSCTERTLPSDTAMPTVAAMNVFVADHGWWRTSALQPFSYRSATTAPSRTKATMSVSVVRRNSRRVFLPPCHS